MWLICDSLYSSHRTFYRARIPHKSKRARARTTKRLRCVRVEHLLFPLSSSSSGRFSIHSTFEVEYEDHVHIVNSQQRFGFPLHKHTYAIGPPAAGAFLIYYFYVDVHSPQSTHTVARPHNWQNAKLLFDFLPTEMKHFSVESMNGAGTRVYFENSRQAEIADLPKWQPIKNHFVKVNSSMGSVPHRLIVRIREEKKSTIA